MDSSVTEKALFSSGLRPSENSSFPVTLVGMESFRPVFSEVKMAQNGFQNVAF